MEHSMSLNRLPFDMIRDGQKTIELRLYDEKRQRLQKGDIIRFTCAEDEKYVIFVRVTDIHFFVSFDELYASLPLLKCGYTEEDIGNASPKDMESYYTPRQQSKYGVVGIEIELLYSRL